MSRSRCVRLNDLHYKFNACCSPKDMILRSPSIMESFLVRTGKSIITGDKFFKFVDDIAFLFEAEKKKKLSPESLSSIVESMNSVGSSSALDSLRSKLDDDQLLSLVKSRHIQAPCELVAWASWLNSQAENVVKEFARSLESKIPKAPEPEKVQKVEVVNSPKSE